MSETKIPGNLHVDGVEGGDAEGLYDVFYTNYPEQDGFTCFLMDLNDGTDLGTLSDDKFKKSVKSMQLLTNVAECGSAYVVSFTGKYDRFYFAAKGKAREINNRKSTDSWELLSATGNNTGIEGTPEFYTDLMAGEIYKVAHDCMDVASLRHFYSVNPGTGNEPYMQNVTMVVPKDRMTYWVADATHPAWPNSTGTSRDNAGKYTWYDPTNCPLIGIYQAKLVGSAKEASDYSEENRQFTINLAWDSNLRSTKTEGDEALLNVGALNWQGGETYDIYLINDDGSETLLTTVDNVKEYAYNVPQHEQGYQLHYKVTCRPAESDADDPVGLAVTNYITLAIPGYVDEFIWTYAYRSHFDVASHQNSYKNTVCLSPYKYDRTTVPERVVYRKKADGSEVTKIATLKVNSEDLTYTLTYENPMAVDASLRFDTNPLTTSGSISDEIIINDYFLASTANGGDQAGSYYYFIEVENAARTLHIEQVEIPVYCSTMTSSYPYEYTVQEMQDDTDRSLALSNVAKVEMSVSNEKKYDAVSSWDIYKGNNLQYMGTISANADLVSNNITYYTGQITVNSQFGTNTYGTNPTKVQGSFVETSATNHYGIYREKGEETGKYAYAGNVTIKPFTASEVAPYVVYYRVWRAEKYGSSKVLLNELDDQKGKGWNTTYSNVKTYYPIGEATASTDITIVDDIYLDDAFTEGNSKEVTYIVRMYSTPTKPTSENDIEALSADEEQKVYVSEATVDVIYNGGATGIIEVGAEVVNVTYFDMFGRSSATPFKGVNIKVERHADGCVTTSKICN
ncbi:MAG: hypothetical protein ACI30R_10270 [Sodaliphilus sp.]